VNKLKKVSLIILVVFYLAAGANHFRDPESYIKIIPRYFPYPKILNLLAGFFELDFAILLIFNNTRRFAAWGIILLLITFLPTHINMIGTAPIRLGSIVVTPLIAWIRLVVLQPLLILWAWWYTKIEKFSNITITITTK
jgi:uncharacterized membrane protein